MIWKTPRTLDEINASSAKTLAATLGIVFTEIGENYLVATMPVDDRNLQPAGILHGGATVALAESIGSTAAKMATEPNISCVGLEINANHVRSAKPGSFVTGTATPIHIGRSTQVWEIKITSTDQKLISICRLTIANLQF